MIPDRPPNPRWPRRQPRSHRQGRSRSHARIPRGDGAYGPSCGCGVTIRSKPPTSRWGSPPRRRGDRRPQEVRYPHW